MLETLVTFTLFGQIWAFYTVVLIFIFLLFMAEMEEQGGISLTSLVVLSVLLYWKGDGYDDTAINDYLTWGNLCIYLSIGLVYSLTRLYLISRNYEVSYNQNKEDALGRIKRIASKNFFRWILQFPISLIAFLFTDVFTHLSKVITNLFSGVIDSILEMGLRSNKSLIEKERKEKEKLERESQQTIELLKLENKE